jgi:hypothetical protein
MQPREEQGRKNGQRSIPMHADGWVILSFITIACGYAFGVRVPKPIKERRRNH